MNEDTWIVIAAYYEEKSIANVVRNLREHNYANIIVVDDGSEDNTYEEAKEAGAITLEHLVNRGQGAALRTGMEYALQNNAEYIVHFDADGQHRVEDILKMLQPITKGAADITLGSRFLEKQYVPTAKEIVLKLGIVFQWITTGVWLTDTHNGFRAMNRRAASKLKIVQDRMGHATEIIELIRRHGLRYEEVPVKIEYNEYAVSKGQRLRNAFNIAAKNIYHKFLK
jgi:glycosyltransferase involved in cell wall biosynthesis